MQNFTLTRHWRHTLSLPQNSVISRVLNPDKNVDLFSMLETELLVTSCRMGHLSSNRKVAPLLFGRTNCNLFSFKSDFYSSELHASIEPFFTEAWANFAFKAIPNLSSVRFASIISNWITKMFSWPELERTCKNLDDFWAPFQQLWQRTRTFQACL